MQAVFWNNSCIFIILNNINSLIYNFLLFLELNYMNNVDLVTKKFFLLCSGCFYLHFNLQLL